MISLFLHLLPSSGFCLWPVLLSCALSCFHSYAEHEEPARLPCLGGWRAHNRQGIHPGESGWSKTFEILLGGASVLVAWGICRAVICGGSFCCLLGSVPWCLPPGLVPPARARRGGKSSHGPAGGPWHQSPGRGVFGIDTAPPFQAALLLWSHGPPQGCRDKDKLACMSPCLRPTASRSHNSPFLCAVLMPLLFLISSHYVDLTSSAFLGQK